MGDIVAWILWGVFIGALARFFTPGKHKIGLVWTLVLGVSGSLLGGVLATRLLGIGDSDHFDFPSFVIAVIVSVVILSIANRINRMLPDRSRPGE